MDGIVPELEDWLMSKVTEHNILSEVTWSCEVGTARMPAFSH